MEQIDILCLILVIGSFLFVFALIVGGPAYTAYRVWKEKRAFRLRDKRDAGLRARDQVGQKKQRSVT